MKIFAIRDESTQEQKDLAYLLYYEQEKRFYIELPENADAWETPLLLDSFVKRGETTVNSYWSRIWVEQRIVPPDRQNIGEILRDNHLKEYDEYALLILTRRNFRKKLRSASQSELKTYCRWRIIACWCFSVTVP